MGEGRGGAGARVGAFADSRISDSNSNFIAAVSTCAFVCDTTRPWTFNNSNRAITRHWCATVSAARRPTCCCTEAKYGGSACTDQSTLLSAGAVGCTARACSPAQSGCRRSRDRPSPWRRAVCHICIGTGPTPPTHWDWAHPGFGDNEVEIWLGLCYDLRADAPLEPLRNMPSCMLSAKSHAM